MWADTTRAVMSNHDLDLDSPPLADQDIINAVLGAHPRYYLFAIINFHSEHHMIFSNVQFFQNFSFPQINDLK